MKFGGINIPTDVFKRLCEKYQVSELSLFGSALRDDFKEDSDLDFLVEFEPDARIGFLKFSALKNELSDLLKREVDLVSKKGLKRFIRDEVLAGAEVIYAK